MPKASARSSSYCKGMDCSGKDGTVRAVFNTCGPIGVEVTPFKVPSEEERAHDYLWRIHKACPRKASSASSTARTTRMCWLSR